MKNEKKTAVNTAEMMTISRTEYESQQAQLAELKLQNQWLLEQLGLAKKRQFGSSSERIQEDLIETNWGLRSTKPRPMRMERNPPLRSKSL